MSKKTLSKMFRQYCDTSYITSLTSNSSSFSLPINHLMSNIIETPQAVIIHWDLQSIHSSSIPLSVASFSLSFFTKLIFLDHNYNLFLKASFPSMGIHIWQNSRFLTEPRYLPSPNCQIKKLNVAEKDTYLG